MVNSGLGGKGKFEDFLVGRKQEKEQLSDKALNDFIKGAYG